MKVSLIKSTENELKFEIEGEGHTLLNLLQKSIMTDKDVEIAGYTIPHRLINKSIFHVKTKKQKASEVVLTALKAIKEESEEFKQVFTKALKQS